MDQILNQLLLHPDSAKLDGRIISTIRDTPNTFREHPKIHYPRESTSLVTNVAIWVIGHMRKLFDPIFNPSGISPSVKAKYDFYTTFLNISNCSGTFILDIGCGPGYFLCRIAKAYPGIFFVGVDPDLDHLRSAMKRVESDKLDNVTLVHGRIQKPIFQKGIFSGIISTQVFEHFAGDLLSKAFEEVKRISKTGARIVLEVPGQRFNTSNYMLFRILSISKRLRAKYPILEEFRKVGTYPAFEAHQHYVAGYDEKAFDQYLSYDLCFRNFVYTMGPLTGWAHILRCLAKYYGAFTYLPEQILTSFETNFFSKVPGFNLILLYEKVDPPPHVFAEE